MSHSRHTKSIPCHADKSILYYSRNRSIFSLQSSQNRIISMIYLLAPYKQHTTFPCSDLFTDFTNPAYYILYLQNQSCVLCISDHSFLPKNTTHPSHFLSKHLSPLTKPIQQTPPGGVPRTIH